MKILETKKVAGSLDYSPALDGLRAISVLAVMIAHFGLGSTLEPLTNLLPWGHMGVRVFFVLSGFLITSILLKCRERVDSSNGSNMASSVKTFYIRRFLRIFPLYYATILIFFYFGQDSFKTVAAYHVFFLSNTSAATFSGPLATGSLLDPSSAHFWSLSVEEQFYLFWPILVLMAPRNSLIYFLLFLVAFAPVFRALLFLQGYAHIIAYLPACTDSLGAGALLALIRNGDFPRVYSKIFHSCVGFSSFVFVACILMYNLGIGYRLNQVIFPTSESFIYSFFVYLLLSERTPKISNALCYPPLIFIGKISFGIYLLHTLVGEFFVENILDVSENFGLLQFLLSASATILVASVSWYFFERPINNLKARFPY